ncbi:MAG TPA: hypothetical protein VM432_01140 [Bdellovibrionales bacterium]|nr:hypothetical protein [Bdellovibrionales bacterium]
MSEADRKTWAQRLKTFDIGLGELISTILIGAATLLSAWCGYQSTQWAAINDDHDTKGLAALQRSVEYSIIGNQKFGLEASLFAQFLDAYHSGDKQLAEFVYNRFPDNLKRATDLWLQSKPLKNPHAPRSPFVTSVYEVPARKEADKAMKESTQHSALGDEATDNANSFVFVSVLFTTVLFLASIATKMTSKILEEALLGFSLVFFVLSLGSLMTLPLA